MLVVDRDADLLIAFSALTSICSVSADLVSLWMILAFCFSIFCIFSYSQFY